MQLQKTRVDIATSFFWKLMERGGTQGIQFVVQIILARLLSPEEFGIVAIVMVFINLAQVFVQSGFNTALIQKKELDEIDFSSTFYLSLCVAGIVYLGIYILAPVIAIFYRNESLVLILRILSLTVFTGAFNSIQTAYISRNFLFKKLFKCSFGAMLFSGIVGVVLAYNGFGVWALVIQQLINQVVTSIMMWYIVEWRPSLNFSISRVKALFSFGSKILISSLLETGYRELQTLLIGKLYQPALLGYYNRGQQFPNLIVSNIDGSIQAVMFPTLSIYQDDQKRVKEMMRKAILCSSFLIFPMMIGMAVIAEPLVTVVLTVKWLPAVPFLRIACFTCALWPIHTANLQAINALGRSDIFLKLEILKKIIGIAILAASLEQGAYAIALGGAISSIIATFINAYPNKYLLNYSYTEQLRDIMPSLFISVIMGTLVFLMKFLKISIFYKITFQIIVGSVAYFGMAKLFSIESFDYLMGILKEIIRDRKNSIMKGVEK